MQTKDDIVADWLPRYTGTSLGDFGKYILLVNFSNYVRLFAEWHKAPIRGEDRPMLNSTANGINDSTTTPTNINSMWLRTKAKPPNEYPKRVTPAAQATPPINEYVR